MIYRPIGKTGMSASVIGLGLEFLDNKPYETVDLVISAAMEHGINMLDLFMPGKQVRQNVGRVLAGAKRQSNYSGAYLFHRYQQTI